MDKFNKLPSVEFSKLCLMIEVKIITLFDVVFNTCKEYI